MLLAQAAATLENHLKNLPKSEHGLAHQAARFGTLRTFVEFLLPLAVGFGCLLALLLYRLD